MLCLYPGDAGYTSWVAAKWRFYTVIHERLDFWLGPMGRTLLEEQLHDEELNLEPIEQMF